MHPGPGSELWTSPCCSSTRGPGSELLPCPLEVENPLEMGFFLAERVLLTFPAQIPQPHLKVARSVLAPKCKHTQENVERMSRGWNMIFIFNIYKIYITLLQ